MKITFRWLGVAGLEFQTDDQTLLIDPFFTRPPLTQLFFGRVVPNRELIVPHISRADSILITHAHYDHLMDVPVIAQITGATAYGSRNACELLELLGVPTAQIREIHVGDELSLGDFRIDVLRAKHMWVPMNPPGALPRGLTPPLRLRDYVMDECSSFLIRIGETRLLDWTGVFDEGVPADGLFTQAFQDEKHYASLVRSVNPRLVVPIHWDDFFRPLSKPLVPFFAPPRSPFPFVRRIDLRGFQQAIEGELPKTRVVVPELFRKYEVK